MTECTSGVRDAGINDLVWFSLFGMRRNVLSLGRFSFSFFCLLSMSRDFARQALAGRLAAGTIRFRQTEGLGRRGTMVRNSEETELKTKTGEWAGSVERPSEDDKPSGEGGGSSTLYDHDSSLFRWCL